MASPVSHIIYTKRYFDSLESGRLLEHLSDEERSSYPLGKIDKDKFILSCAFPDIRRIDNDIKRKDTHLCFDKLNLDFSGLTDFQMGWKFHLYCDMKREEILNKYGFYQLKNADDFYGHPAKCLEDELLYDDFDNWEKLCHYFNGPPFIQALPKVEEETFKLWYAIVAKYLETKPNNATIRVFLSKQPSLSGNVNSITESLDKLRKNKKVVEILLKVKEEII